MPEPLLTPRDQKALILLVQARIDGEPSATKRVPWEGVRQRLAGELSARPKSLAPALATLVNSARAGQLGEVDRVAKGLVGALVDHGDLEGSNVLRKVADAKYDPPAPPKPAPRSRGEGGAGSMRELDDGSANSSAVEWFPARDMRSEMVLDAHTGPELERLVAELRLAETFLEAGIDAPTRILFTGPPGTGKTTAAKWIGGHLELPVAVARLDSIVGKYLGETAGKMKEALIAATSRKGILFLDEIDGICQSRETDGGGGAAEEMKRVTSALLQQLDMLPAGQIVIAATNFPDRLDPALRSRLHVEIGFRNPDPEARRLMVVRLWAKVAHAHEAVHSFVSGTDGRSGRFIRAGAMAAARIAMLEAAQLGTALASLEGKVDLAVTKVAITAEHVTAALEQIRKRGER